MDYYRTANYACPHGQKPLTSLKLQENELYFVYLMRVTAVDDRVTHYGVLLTSKNDGNHFQLFYDQRQTDEELPQLISKSSLERRGIYIVGAVTSGRRFEIKMPLESIFQELFRRTVDFRWKSMTSEIKPLLKLINIYSANKKRFLWLSYTCTKYREIIDESRNRSNIIHPDEEDIDERALFSNTIYENLKGSRSINNVIELHQSGENGSDLYKWGSFFPKSIEMMDMLTPQAEGEHIGYKVRCRQTSYLQNTYEDHSPGKSKKSKNEKLPRYTDDKQNKELRFIKPFKLFMGLLKYPQTPTLIREIKKSEEVMVSLKESHGEQAPPYDAKTTVACRPSRTYNSSRSVNIPSESRPAPSTALVVRNGSTRPRTPLATRIQRRWIKPCINRRASNIPQANPNV